MGYNDEGEKVDLKWGMLGTMLDTRSLLSQDSATCTSDIVIHEARYETRTP